MNRRSFLSAGALLATGAWPGRLRAQGNGKGENFTFLAVNDLHFKEDACAPWFEKVVAAMKLSAPDAQFCLIGGDLADEGKEFQLAGARAAFEKLGLPLYATPGNHDHLTDTDRTAYEKHFPGQSNQFFTHRGWQFVGLDSSEGTRYEKTKIQPATFDWLGTNLPKLSKAAPTVIFTHFPLGPGVTYRPSNADALLEKFLEFNLQATLSGHWHGFTEKKLHNSTLTTNRCCSRVRGNHDGTKEKGWFVCETKDGALTRRFVEIPGKE